MKAYVVFQCVSYILVAAVFASLGVYGGRYWEQSLHTYTRDYTPMTRQHAIEFIELCIDSHQYPIDNAESCNVSASDVAFHRWANENYRPLLEYLIKGGD
jgi:hypothetical protein